MSDERALSRRSMLGLGLGAAVGAVSLRVLGRRAPLLPPPPDEKTPAARRALSPALREASGQPTTRT